MIDAVVMAGGRIYDESARFVMPETSSPLGGTPMVCRVVRALSAAPSVGRIYVVGHPSLRAVLAGEDAVFAEGADSILEALRRACRLPKEGRPFLLSAADIPLMTAASVEHFLTVCTRQNAAAVYPIVRRERMEAVYPGARRTYVHLADGTFTGGNLFWLGGGAAESLLGLAERIYLRRKHPWRLAALLGWRLCLAFLLRRLTSAEAAESVSQLLGREVRAVITPYAELAMDADKESDVILIEKYLR